MYKEEVILKNKTGLHARPASLFVREAAKFSSDIKVIKDNKEYNAKSIMGILSMGAGKGDVITIEAAGKDAGEAIEALVGLVNNKFNEEE